MHEPGRTVAAFDFDGTLSRRDSLLPFLQHVCGANRLYRALGRTAPGVAAGLVRGRLDRDAAKDAVLVRLLAGRRWADVAAEGERFADLLLAGRLRQDTLARAEHHREQGDELVIVSASPAVYLAPLGARLGFDAVLATRLEVDPDGVLTGRMEGRNCRGPEKVARLEAWLAGDRPRVVAYGDSSGDRELLARADEGVLVRRVRVPRTPT